MQPSRNSRVRALCGHLLLGLALCFACLKTINGQELVKNSTKSNNPDEIAVAERVRLLESELEKQNAKLDELQTTINKQQAAIQALLEKLSLEKPSSANVTVPSPAPVEANASVPSAAETVEPQPSPIEQRLAKVEGQVLKIGPFKLSGDFRLRFDGTFRRASKSPDPPLDHVQNARARYRLRLNFDADLYPNLSFHGQLATGPLNNQLSTNQDFTSLTVRHPFSISEAWPRPNACCTSKRAMARVWTIWRAGHCSIAPWSSSRPITAWSSTRADASRTCSLIIHAFCLMTTFALTDSIRSMSPHLKRTVLMSRALNCERDNTF